jgi:hypothetical protein
LIIWGFIVLLLICLLIGVITFSILHLLFKIFGEKLGIEIVAVIVTVIAGICLAYRMYIARELARIRADRKKARERR